MSLTDPSFANGFASPWYGGRMKYADLWRGCVGSWSPLLGSTGATVFDQSGRCNHGTLTNMDPATDWVVGQHGHSLDFDGTNEFVKTTSPFAAVAASPISISAWVLTRTIANAGGYYRRIVVPGGTQVFTLVVNAGKPTVYYYTTSQIELPDPSALDVNVWYHIATTYDGATVRLFRNGAQVAAASASVAAIPDGPVRIGIYIDESNGMWDGQLADVGLFTRALSPNEISFLAQRPGIMLELDDSDAWGAVEAGGSVPWWAFANRQSRIIGGGVT